VLRHRLGHRVADPWPRAPDDEAHGPLRAINPGIEGSMTVTSGASTAQLRVSETPIGRIPKLIVRVVRSTLSTGAPEPETTTFESAHVEYVQISLSCRSRC
jgi:hypothetical protein